MKTALVLAVFGVFLATPAFAQSDDSRVRLSFGAGLSAGTGDGELSLSGSAGYRFSKHFSFEAEFTSLDDGEARFDPPLRRLTVTSGSGTLLPGTALPQNIGRIDSIASIFPFPIEGGVEGSTLMMTAGFRYELPVEGTRFRPYVSGGLGLARTEHEIDFSLAQTTPPNGRVSSTVSASNTEFEEEFSRTGVMASAGVGASVRVYKELSIDLNARYFRLDRGRNLGSFGGGVSYRF